MSEFSKFGGYDVKDKVAREQIEDLQELLENIQNNPTTGGGTSIYIGEDTPTNNELLWLKKNKNLILEGNWKKYYKIASDGISYEFTQSARCTPDFIKITRDEYFTVYQYSKEITEIFFYNSNKELLGTYTPTENIHSFKEPYVNTQYIRFNTTSEGNAIEGNFMVLLGQYETIDDSTRKIGVLPKLYALNNGVYEEIFTFKDLDNFVTSDDLIENYAYNTEIKTNEKIYGKSVYKIIVNNGLPKEGTNTLAVMEHITNTNDIESIWIDKGNSFCEFKKVGSTSDNNFNYHSINFGDEINGTSINGYIDDIQNLIYTITTNSEVYSDKGNLLVVIKYTKVNG